MTRIAVTLLLVGCSSEPLHPTSDAGPPVQGHCYADAFRPCVRTDFGPCTSTYRGWVTTSDGTLCSDCPACTGEEAIPVLCRDDVDCVDTEYCLYICVPLSDSAQ